VLSDGDYSTFATDPISAGLLGVALLFLVGSFIGHFRDRRKQPKDETADDNAPQSKTVKGHS
jgi:putative tricarboxylic transport membrane protein